ncbi:MAG: tungstate ABC transporter substrate-binding protein WtpA [Methanoregula sp.]|nr:tungstate ABC transporter substrate-binding protein WtpA [Methanoregula sp.]
MTCAGRTRVLVLVIILVHLSAAAGCVVTEPKEKTPIRVLAAGSLLLPLEGVETRFETDNPGTDVQIEGHGSIQVIRQVTDLHRPVDVVMVADESLIPDMMYRTMEGGTRNYTDGYIPFATNSMVIAYTNRSRYADEITRENWRTVLARPDVRTGFSNPMLDAAGYRALIVVILAERYYHDTGLFDRLIGTHFDPPLTMETDNGTTAVTLPPVLRPCDKKVAVRDGSIYLISLLSVGGIDYAFEYRSVAEGQNLSFIPLPGEIDLSSPAFSEEYSHARVVLGFERFSSLGRVRTGAPIVYAVTVPNTASHPELAEQFMNFTLARAQEGGNGWPAPPGGIKA